MKPDSKVWLVPPGISDELLPQTLPELTRDGSALRSVSVSSSYRIRDEISTNSGSNDHELISFTVNGSLNNSHFVIKNPSARRTKFDKVN